ncbi:MAG: hypothetical protein M0000_06585, partial [Actinomycetota bacterium]|nr:hypothetical protein [Actinomycetota bacterium]
EMVWRGLAFERGADTVIARSPAKPGDEAIQGVLGTATPSDRPSCRRWLATLAGLRDCFGRCAAS